MSEGRAPRAEGFWGRLATTVMEHPGRILALALLLLVPPLLALPSMRLSNDTLEELPDGTGSVEGFELLAEHFPPGTIAPLILVIDDDASVFDPGSFRALGDLSRNLKRLDGVASVRSVAMPTDGERPELTTSPEAEQLAELPTRLQEAASGARRIENGLAQARTGVVEIDERLPELRSGLTEAVDGVGQLIDGAARVRDGLDQLDAGLSELRTGLAEARHGAGRLRQEVAVPAEEAIRSAWSRLFEDFTVGRSDPAYPEAVEAVGEAFGYITGRDPTTGAQVDPQYEGLPAALGELEAGLGEAIGGVDELRAGVGRLDDGLARLVEGLQELQTGLAEAGPGIDRLATGIDELLAGLARLEEGAAQLADGLGQGASRIEEAGLGELLLGDEGGPFVLTAGMVQALPDVREQLEFFVTQDATRTRVFVGLDASPFSPEAVALVPDIRETAQRSLQSSPLEDAEVVATGVSAFFEDLDEAVDRDFLLIVVAVIVGVFLVLVLLLRAVVAPIYMVATVLLSFGTALGLTTIVYQGLLGHQGLAWWIPPFLYVLLVALGADYNIYMMSRVREEAMTRTTRHAVAEGLRLTGGVITSAGLILAGTFAALMAAPMTSLAQMGFATTVGILLDTFVVRSFLVPSLAILIGRHNWWPSQRAYAD